jgi:hypothetical protein
MHEPGVRLSLRSLILLTLLGWLSMIGFDFFLHAGLLARLYLTPSPFLRPATTAFRLIPVGYLSLLVLALILVWLMTRLQMKRAWSGAVFGLQLGGAMWGALVLGLLSISTAADFLAQLNIEGRTLTTILKTNQYSGLDDFLNVGSFVPLTTDHQGMIVREVTPAYFLLARPNRDDEPLLLSVALIRDLRISVPCSPSEEDLPRAWWADVGADVSALKGINLNPSPGFRRGESGCVDVVWAFMVTRRGSRLETSVCRCTVSLPTTPGRP